MNSSEAGSRFTQAHELCHILFDRNHARRVSHASTPWAPAMVEQRANAFAAMLLMPRDLVRRLISAAPENLTLNDIQGAASAMCVSLRALINHMANMGDMPDESRERLMDELEGFYLQPAQGPRIM
jgi:Zn-dependent peptidase ImmA (M78 family)